jgi:glycosyltransferase involved in cell wall biosynthesis
MSSEDSDILLSVVVPTKGRPECVSSLLRGLSANTANRFEVIVHDNSDDRHLDGLIEELNDERIRYIYTDLTLNMHENFDLAIGYARGDYICTIGDDDSILVADALEVLGRAKRQNIDAVVTERYSYQWPGIRHPLWGDMGGMLSGHPEAENAEDMVVSPQAELEWVLRSGGVLGMHRLPRIYHGFVSRKSMDALFNNAELTSPEPAPIWLTLWPLPVL